MNIIFMGTPDFAVPTLEMLAGSGNNVSLVVTKPDRPGKRGSKLVASPVKLKASELGITVSQPEQIKGNVDFEKMIANEAPDLIVVAAYGKILPPTILSIPPLGSVNIHASLLPKFRGAAPIHRAVLQGEITTGVTLMCMSEGLDEGDILAVSETAVDGRNTGELHDELAVLGAELLKDKLTDIAGGTIERRPQNRTVATYAPMIEKEEGHLNFEENGEQLVRRVKAMTPFPGAFAYLDDRKVTIIEAYASESESPGTSGAVLGTSSKGIEVKAGGKSILVITELKMPGKKAMDSASFLRGNKLEEGRLFR